MWQVSGSRGLRERNDRLPEPPVDLLEVVAVEDVRLRSPARSDLVLRLGDDRVERVQPPRGPQFARRRVEPSLAPEEQAALEVGVPVLRLAPDRVVERSPRNPPV